MRTILIKLDGVFNRALYSMMKPTKRGTRERHRETVIVAAIVVMVGFIISANHITLGDLLR